MQIHENANLKSFHTFSIDVTCSVLVTAHSIEDLIAIYQNEDWLELPKLLLGKGSNVLFTEHFLGVVIINKIEGVHCRESEQHWHIHVNGGEDWPKLVEWSLDNGFFGLENLALIPGCAGSAPIQNIGAYGVEFKDVCEYVDVLNLDSLVVSRIEREDCMFGYRDSVFKHELKNKVVIVAVGIQLNKSWHPVSSYGPLRAIGAEEISPSRIFKEVVATRMSKLPDPSVTGNAGSFFKNPVISKEKFEQLKTIHPDIVAYQVDEGFKIAAGWLIDSCSLKGEAVGGAMVHEAQALVLVNANKATAMNVVELALQVRKTVLDKYGIKLEHEVRFFDRTEETSLDSMVKHG